MQASSYLSAHKSVINYSSRLVSSAVLSPHVKNQAAGHWLTLLCSAFQVFVMHSFNYTRNHRIIISNHMLICSSPCPPPNNYSLGAACYQIERLETSHGVVPAFVTVLQAELSKSVCQCTGSYICNYNWIHTVRFNNTTSYNTLVVIDFCYLSIFSLQATVFLVTFFGRGFYWYLLQCIPSNLIWLMCEHICKPKQKRQVRMVLTS